MAKKPVHAHHDHDDDDPEDGCLCDLELSDDELMADEDLPPSAGGVASDVGTFEEDLDGCDVDFAKGRKTADVDLPPSTGGVL